MNRVAILSVIFSAAALGQDEVRVASPNGQVEMRVGVAKPDVPGAIEGLAYQLHYRGKPLIETSYLGFEIYHQAPLLGEKVGLVTSEKSAGPNYNSLIAEYMQNGSLGRRITMEIRAYDNGVAFRYLIPRSIPLENLLIQNEITEYRFAPGVDLAALAPGSQVPYPFATQIEGGPWVGIAATSPASLAHYEGRILVTRLAPLPDKLTAIETKTPWTSPWRVITIAPARDSALVSSIVKSLDH